MQGLKWNHYIAVHTGNEVRLVTKLDNSTKSAFWNKDEKPITFSVMTAKDIAWALSINGFRAFVITTLEKYETQPFVIKAE